MRKPRQAFSNHPQPTGNNGETFSSKISFKKDIRKNSNSYHSFAPDTTYIIKRNFIGGLAIILATTFFLFLSIRNFLMLGFSYTLLGFFSISMLLFIFGVDQLIKNIIKGYSPNKEYKIILSNKGLNLEGIFYNWSVITKEKVIRTKVFRYTRFYLYFYIPEAQVYVKYPLENFQVNISELKYLLEVYRNRSEERVITKSEKYEQKYLNLSKEKMNKYVIG